MRSFRLTFLVLATGCVSLAMRTSVTPLATPAPTKAPDAPIALYHDTKPACAYDELALVTVKASMRPSDADMAARLQAAARQIGGDAVINVTQGSSANALVSQDAATGDIDVTHFRELHGTVVRCKR